MKTFLFLHGSMKSGTTWLWKNLEQSPEFFGGGTKEWRFWPAFFSPQLLQKQLSQLDEPASPALRFRKSCLENPSVFLESVTRESQRDSNIRVLGDMTPSVGLDSETLDSLARLMLDRGFISKGLLLMRDPVERVFSEMSMKVRNNRPGFEIDPDSSQLAISKRIDEILRTQGEALFERSRYEKIIGSWDELREPIESRAIYFESMFSQSAMDKITDFLQMSPVVLIPRIIGGGKKLNPTLESRRFVAQQLSSTYEFCAAGQIAGRLPDMWKKSMELR